MKDSGSTKRCNWCLALDWLQHVPRTNQNSAKPCNWCQARENAPNPSSLLVLACFALVKACRSSLIKQSTSVFFIFCPNLIPKLSALRRFRCYSDTALLLSVGGTSALYGKQVSLKKFPIIVIKPRNETWTSRRVLFRFSVFVKAS